MRQRLTTFAAGSLPFATWESSTALSFALSAASASSVAWGTFANAASVGAKTVNGAGPDNVLARPAFFTSDTKVVNFPDATAVWTMFFEAACAGTRSVRAPAVAGPMDVTATAAAAPAANTVRVRVIGAP